VVDRLAHDLAQANRATKDPYVFDFLDLDLEARERNLERTLLDHLQAFLSSLAAASPCGATSSESRSAGKALHQSAELSGILPPQQDEHSLRVDALRVLVHEERPPPPTPRERAFERQALRHIQASLEKWQDVNAADVRALPRAQLERLCEVDGDDYLWRMAQAEAQRRARDRDDGGGRER
jgi:hypothetical protein